MTTSTVTPEIAAFAAAVRQALADLPADERDELTEGLEADLAEADAEDLRRELPDPVEYAAELRTAAGLPERPSARRGVVDVWRGIRRDAADQIAQNPALSQVAEFLQVVRPVWWVLRAWVAVWLLSAVFGSESGFVPVSGWSVVLLAAVVVSVQWGRGRWAARRLGPVILIGNVAAALLLVPVGVTADQARSYVAYEQMYDDPDLTGVYLDGSQVTNIFPYDAEGEPLTDVQLFDENGRRLATSVPGGNGCVDESTCEQYGVWVARALSNGLSAFNVYPLRMLPTETTDLGSELPAEGAEPVDKPAPFETVPSVVGTEKVSPDND